jgi:hypothetical protein
VFGRVYLARVEDGIQKGERLYLEVLGHRTRESIESRVTDGRLSLQYAVSRGESEL